MTNIEIAKDKFGKIILSQIERVKKMKETGDFVNYKKLDKIIIGIVLGDGIGPSITKEAQRILEFILADEVKKGKVEFKFITDLTIEKRIEVLKAIPDHVAEELKECHVILKGPTTTPQKGDGMPNIESANVAMRKLLDLFANVRPIKIPEKNIDWTFFRENTEGSYALGSAGFDFDEDISFDFCVTTTEGSERIIRSAFEYAKNNNKSKVSAVTKANVVKTTDGKFLEIFNRIAKEYPNIQTDEWYIDIMTAKLLDEKRRSSFEVLVMPNLYGDILTDEAAEIQGGVGTAGSANLGKKYAMFEAIHGSAPRMVKEGREKFADPTSIIKAAELLLEHIGYNKEAIRLSTAIQKVNSENKIKITGRADGNTCSELADAIISNL